MLLTNSRSGPGGQEGPLPGPLPSTGAEAGRGTSAVQIVISCRRTVAETREAELGGGKTGAGFSQPPPACIHTHTHTLSLSLSLCLPTSPYSHILTRLPQSHTHTTHNTYTHSPSSHIFTHTPPSHTQTHRHTPDLYTHAVTHCTFQSLQHCQPCSA